jgi:hypothetical protein
MSRTTTSLRLDDDLREKLARAAKRERTSVSALIERYVREGMLMEEHPGIIFQTNLRGTRDAVVSGATKVWLIISDLRRFEGSDQERTAGLAEEMDWQPWKIEAALKYYAANRDEIDDAIHENDSHWEAQAKLEAERRQLIR